MKKIAFLLVLTILAISCKEASQETVTVEGEFIYTADAAVLKGDTFIYGVTLDKETEALAMTVKPLQRDAFDMVPVIVEGIITKKEEGAEGWDEILTIIKVLEVKTPKGEAPIKIEGDQSQLKLDDLKQVKNSN